MSDFVVERGQDWDGNLPPSIVNDRSRDSSREVLGSFEDAPEQPQSIASRESYVRITDRRALFDLRADDRQAG